MPRSLHLADIQRNLAPLGNADRVPAAPRVDVDVLRRDALEALHSYLCAATDHDLARAMLIFRRVTTTLDSQLAAGR